MSASYLIEAALSAIQYAEAIYATAGDEKRTSNARRLRGGTLLQLQRRHGCRVGSTCVSRPVWDVARFIW